MFGSAPFTICVRHHPRGHWEVIMGDGREPISCETLDDARRIAYLAVAHQRPCELIIRDAYNRIAERELIEGNRHPRPSRGRVGAGDPASARR
jgi:hypothetical protein